MKSKDYSKEELRKISEVWQLRKAEIELKNPSSYHYDLDKLYERALSNEKGIVVEVFKGILKNGYYSASKAEEKRVRAHLGKAVSRQYYRKLKK